MRRWVAPPADRVVPLSERKVDVFFVSAFAFLIVTDSVNGPTGALDPESPCPVERIIYDAYARLADRLLIVIPPQVRVSAWISAFVWLPSYVVFVFGFVRGIDRIRPLGLGGVPSRGDQIVIDQRSNQPVAGIRRAADGDEPAGR